MAKAYASSIINAPVETVWAAIRDFGVLSSWHPAVVHSEIEGGRAPDEVGCIRFLRLQDGGEARERLLTLDDSRYRFSYNFETPAFPVANYIATLELVPVTNGDVTLAQWSAQFDEQPQDAGKYADIISNTVFAGGLAALAERLDGAVAPETSASRWQGFRPAKVFCSSVMRATVSEVWTEMRNFAGMSGWHPEIKDMRMLDGAASDKVSGVRDFRFGAGSLQEQLTYLSDHERAFRYKINVSAEPWTNYHAGVQLHAVTASNGCLAIWTADWSAATSDDARLVPMVHDEVFQRALDTLDAKLRSS